MMTVNEVSKLTGVSIRTLQYYDKIGLLHPTDYTEAGYRLYDDAALETLQQILLFRELEFPLKDIKEIIGSPDFDRSKALEQQIELLELKKEGLTGIEGYYSEYTWEHISEYRAMAERLSLALSGGSDYHAQMKPHIQIGVGNGDLRVPYYVLENIKAIINKDND